jgi:hypothetical protein
MRSFAPFSPEESKEPRGASFTSNSSGDMVDEVTISVDEAITFRKHVQEMTENQFEESLQEQFVFKPSFSMNGSDFKRRE